MGTRSITIFKDEGVEICRFHLQYDGYPDGHGQTLAKICASRKMVNGFSNPLKEANGMGCLAALIISKIKGNKAGGLYMIEAHDGIDIEYIYTIDLPKGAKNVIIECTTDSKKPVFYGTPKEWLEWLVECQKEES
jgi:hypothetical protein